MFLDFLRSPPPRVTNSRWMILAHSSAELPQPLTGLHKNCSMTHNLQLSALKDGAGRSGVREKGTAKKAAKTQGWGIG